MLRCAPFSVAAAAAARRSCGGAGACMLLRRGASAASATALSRLAPIAASHVCTAAALTTGPDHWAHKEADAQQKFNAAQERKATGGLPVGCLNIDALNVEKEITRSDVPTMLLMHVVSHPEVKAYTAMMCMQVANINREYATRATTAEQGNKLAVKLGLLNCEKEAALAQQFRVNGQQFPMLYFLIGGRVVDQAVGIMDEVMIRDAIVQFVTFADQNSSKIGKVAEKPPRLDGDEENAVTLLNVAMRKLQEKDFAKVTMLLALKQSLGVGVKKMSPEILDKLRKDANMIVLPQIMCTRAMMALGQHKYDEAGTIVNELRREYPWATRDLKQVADCVCRVEMIRLADYDLEADNYITLLRRDDKMKDPVEFYNNQIKLACTHYFEKKYDHCIDELLKLIRMETKIMPLLKERGLIDKWSAPHNSSMAERATGANTSTLARRLIFLVFEAVGNDNQMVIAARKRLAAYL